MGSPSLNFKQADRILNQVMYPQGIRAKLSYGHMFEDSSIVDAVLSRGKYFCRWLFKNSTQFKVSTHL